MSILDEELGQVNYSEIKGFSENLERARQFVGNTDICNWAKFPYYLDIGEGYLMLPKSTINKYKNRDIGISDIEFFMQNSYYELIVHFLEKSIKNNDFKCVFYYVVWNSINSKART